MGFSKYDKGRPFLLVTRHAKPPKGSKTEKKEWYKETGWQVQEEVSIVDKVENKHLINCSIILDIFRRRLVKNRFANEADDNEVIKHYLQVYKNEIAEGIQLWMRGHSTEIKEAENLIQDIEDELHDIEINIKS